MKVDHDACARYVSMGMTRLQTRGQMTVPAKVRKATELQPGDNLLIQAKGKGVFEVRALPTFRSVEDMVNNYSVPGKADMDQLKRQMGDDMARSHSYEHVDRAVKKEVATARE